MPGMVVDSPFSNLRSLALELVGKYTDVNVPNIALKAALGMIKSSVKSRAGGPPPRRLPPPAACRRLPPPAAAPLPASTR